MGRYKCHKCENEHGTDNMVAYCASCYAALKAKVAELEVQEKIAKSCGQWSDKEKCTVAEAAEDRVKELEAEDQSRAAGYSNPIDRCATGECTHDDPSWCERGP